MRSLTTRAVLTAAALAVTGVSLAASATDAFGVTEIERILETCGTQTVCQYGGASISNAPAVTNALPQGVRVVVIPLPDQAESIPSSALASGLRQASGADTVIVIEDRVTDRFAVASNQDAAALTKSLYSQGASDGGVAVVAIAPTLTPASGGGSDIGSPVGGGWVVALVAAAVVGGSLVALFKRRGRRANQRRAVASSRALAASLNGADGDVVQDAIARLDERAAALPEIGPRIEELSGHLSEMFVRVGKRGTDQQARLLQGRYKDTLTKLLGALDDDYYGDIRANPDFWSEPQARLAEVERAVDSVNQQAVDNIKQINESRDLEFRIALDSLINTVNEAKLSDVYSEREK